MPTGKTVSSDYKLIDAAIKNGKVGSLYIFHGEEHYLRDRYIESLRKHLCPNGLDGFNYKRFEGKTLTADLLEETIDTLPVFSDRTFIEIRDYQLFPRKRDSDEPPSEKTKKKDAKKTRRMDEPPMQRILTSLPDYVCVLIIFDTIEYKPDTRTKYSKDILQHAQVIEFSVQDRGNLTKWLMNHYKTAGKKIGRAEAEHLIHITGGHMSTLKNEVEKTSAFSKDEFITRSDIDAVVIPELDAIVYQLSDAIIKREHIKAIRILDELLRMREAPQKLIFSISLKMRQLLAARACIESKLGKPDLMKMCAINYDFQAQMLLDTARKTTLHNCCRAVLDCAQAALDLNSAPDPEARMVELVARLALL